MAQCATQKENGHDSIPNLAQNAGEAWRRGTGRPERAAAGGTSTAFQTPADGEVIPWLDQPEANPVPEVIVQQLDVGAAGFLAYPDGPVLRHQALQPTCLNESDWRLEISGLVDQPMTLTLDDLKARERQEVTFTLECSGNTGCPSSMAASATRPGRARRCVAPG